MELPPSFKPHGFKTGHLSILPALAYDVTYTDNAARASRNPRADVLSEYAPSFGLRFEPDENVLASALYEFGWHDYTGNVARDYLSHRATSEIRASNALVQGLSISAGDNYLQTGNSNALENNVLAFTQYQTNQAFAKTQYEFNRFTLSGKCNFGLTEYLKASDASADCHTQGGELEGAYRFLPGRLSLFGTYNLTRTLRATTDVNDFDTHTALVGVRGAYCKLDYSVSAGYSEALFLHQAEEHNGPSFEANLSYSPHRRLRATVSASRRFAVGVLTGPTTDTNLRATLTLLLTRRGRFVLDYTRNDSRYLNGFMQLSLAYTASFEYKFARQVAGTIGYARTEREVSIGTDWFRINEARLGMRLTW